MIKGIYINNFSTIDVTTLQSYINKFITLNFNAVVIDIFTNDMFTNNIDKINLLYNASIYIICRIVVVPEDVEFTLVDPSNLVYLDSIINIINFISSFKITNEIQLDYIRYPVNYNLLTTDNKTLVIRNAIEYITSKKKDIKISLDLFGFVLMNNNSVTIGQNIHFANIVDYISPMIYPCHWGKKFCNIESPKDKPYEIINLVMKQHIRNNGVKYISCLRPYIRGWNCDKLYIDKQIKALRDNNINSYLLWTNNITSTLNVLLGIK